MSKIIKILFLFAAIVSVVFVFAFESEKDKKPQTPRIDYVEPAAIQAHSLASETIWFDDFNGDEKSYAEGGTLLDSSMSFGGIGKSMLCYYKKGEQGVGGGKVFFGDSPSYSERNVRRGEKFDEIYWRIYVKHEYGWTGSPAKMSRATSIVGVPWAQSMIAHVWAGSGSSLTLDPASGVLNDKVITTRYNDFERLKWLGNKPVSDFPIHATEESGYWVLVESRVKLNTPGKSDGINQLWIDGRLECERRNLDFRGNYTKHGINAVFLEAYWNDGSPVSQSRWYDNFVISTVKIGPVACTANPTIIKTPFRGLGQAGEWQFEVAADFNGNDVVFRSKKLAPGNESVIDETNGSFIGNLSGKKQLETDQIFYIRVRQSNSDHVFSDWSRWHQGFKVQ